MTTDTHSNSPQHDASDEWISTLLAHSADNKVMVLAYGDDAAAVFQQVATVCSPMQLLCHWAQALPSLGAPHCGALVIYQGPTDSELDFGDLWLGALVEQAYLGHVPLIFLTHWGDKSDAVASLEQWAFHERLGRISFGDPGEFTDMLRAALCEIFSQHRLVLATHHHGWPQNIYEGLKSRQLAATLAAVRLKETLTVIDEYAWIQKQRELIAEGQAAVSRARELAQEVLAPGFKLPIPIFVIAKKYGLGVRRDHPVTNFSGLLSGSGGVGAFQLNPDDPITRQRFTCAHELGHFVLGHTASIPGELAARPVHISPDDVYDPIELAADAFAAEVLMPEADVRQHVSAGDSLGRMTRVFGVSEAAMRKRLAELGF